MPASDGITRVLVNATGVQMGGGATQLHNFARFADLDDELEYTMVVSDAGLIPEVERIRVEVPSFSGSRRLAPVVWHQWGVNRMARNHDVVLSIANQGPIRCRRPHVLFAQNVKHLVPRRAGLTAFFRDAFAKLATSRADVVVVPSAHMADLVEAIGPRGEVVTAPHGFDTNDGSEDVLASPAVQSWLECGQRYLFVGSDAEHKNLELLAAGMATLAGPGTSLLLTLDEAVMKANHLDAPGAHGVGRVDSEALATLYRSSTCVVVPSHQESFSLPVLEALGYGVQVAASDIPVHREFGSSFATYFDPLDVTSLEAALTRVTAVPTEEWRHAARSHASTFSWQGQYDTIRAALLTVARA